MQREWADIIKPYLRGQDIKRWSPEWRGLWIVVLKSSSDHVWPWTEAEDAEGVFRRTYPSLHAHMKDEALSPVGVLMEKLPIAPPTNEARGEAEYAARRLISLARSGQEARRDTLDWLRVEFGVEKAGQKLQDFATLGTDMFVDEVRKRRPKGEGRLTPGALRDLKSGYAEMAEPVHEARTEAAGLERRLSGLVNEAYGLTGEEVALLWKTAPPRMPGF